jgi:hypothetical protein
MGVRAWILLPMVLCAVLSACSADESEEPEAGASTRVSATTTDASGPETLGGQLMVGISAELGATLAAQPIDDYSAVQNRWVMNGHGDVLVLTADYGVPRDESAECPAAWTGTIRWASSDGSNRSWTAQVAPDYALPTVRGFILFGSCTPEGVPAPNWPWYVDGSGQIGPLHTISGPPPAGVEAINPRQQLHECEEEGSYLVEADSDRVWQLEPISEIPAGVCAHVVAQDETGVQWVQTNARYRPEAALWWRGPGERAWHRRSYATPAYGGKLLYSGNTIGILGQSGARMDQFTLQVSTDRGRTWTTRPLGVAHDFGARWLSGSWDLRFEARPDGTLVGFVNTNAAQQQSELVPHLVRSTDPRWTTFERVPGAPPGWYAYSGLGPAFGICDTDLECHVTIDAGDTWRSFMVPAL